MATSEIEKLERRYAENPHGLTFAPLAEVHRKNGDVARALELLTAGLELRLDDENVIALKSLADINERQERFGEAETWLRRLVSVDRSNDEAREQLQRIEAARQGDKQAPVAEAPAPTLEMIDLTPDEPVAETREPSSSPTDGPPPNIAAMESNRSGLEEPPRHQAASSDEEPAEATPPAPAAASRDEEPADASHPEVGAAAQAGGTVEASSEASSEEEPVRPLPGLISAEFQPPLEATGGLGVETSEEVVLEVSGDSEFRVPDASEDLRSLAARLNRPPFTEPPERQPEAPSAAVPVSTPAVEPEFVVTEAMADVLMQQGHSAEALRVYRELARRDGGDGRLRSRIQELEAAVERQSARPPSYVAADTKGQSVAAFFQALIAARLPASPGAGAGAASRGEAGSVLGEESPAVPPAVPAGEQKADVAVSFDDFFDSEAGESNALQQRSSEPGKDDLDQFQSWLQNLKR
jgi:tetratricopeptide (TPR) repeat protein